MKYLRIFITLSLLMAIPLTALAEWKDINKWSKAINANKCEYRLTVLAESGAIKGLYRFPMAHSVTQTEGNTSFDYITFSVPLDRFRVVPLIDQLLPPATNAVVSQAIKDTFAGKANSFSGSQAQVPVETTIFRKVTPAGTGGKFNLTVKIYGFNLKDGILTAGDESLIEIPLPDNNNIGLQEDCGETAKVASLERADILIWQVLSYLWQYLNP